MKKKVSVLIVDDDPGMTETLADILDEKGYEVNVAGDGYRAINMIEDKAYDIALMDIKMPGINGVETFKVVKRISPSTKVIMMTAYSLENLVKEALNDGAYGILYKPLDIEKVVNFITEAKKGSLILIVDDNPNTCETLKDVLEEKCYRVITTHSGEEAIQCAKKKDIGLIFIDIKLPILNGLETYLEIKKVNVNITAIMITGYRQEVKELVQEAIKESAYTCLYKPLDMDKVITLVEEITKQKKAGILRKPSHGGNECGRNKTFNCR